MTVEEWLGKENQLGIDIWHRKYQYENETFDEWLDRVSNGNDTIKKLIQEKKFLFGGRILSNRGLDKKGVKVTLSNCYVIAPPEDNIESIYDVASKLARTYSYGGGCGIDISKLAPRGAKVRNTAKYTSGAVSFMETYSQVTSQIGQNGRRGALMISLSCNHPDLEEFLDIKTDLNNVTKANISVRITDDFMKAVTTNSDYELCFIREETGEEIKKVINAREMFMKLAKNNWDFAEPGCLFWDTISQWNLMSEDPDFSYAGTNPCGEQPLPEYGACLLGSLNLSEFVNDDGKFEMLQFYTAVNDAVIALNEVLDEGENLHPLPEQRKTVHDLKQIGLGVMGIADMLIKMKIRYGSVESLDLCKRIAKTMITSATIASKCLAEEKGMFPKCKPEVIIQSPFLNNYVTSHMKNEIRKHGLRNSQLLTIAPTGTLSTMLGISGGIEPIFANYYTRKTESLHGEDVYYKVYTPIVKEYIEKNNLDPETVELPDYFVTANDIPYIERIRMQSTWQEYIDASISSTVNLPNETSIEDVYDLYIQAWSHNLKGITIFRDGCKRIAVLSTDNSNKENNNNELKRGEIIPSSDNLIGLKRKLITGCGSLHCTAYFDRETAQLREVYLSKGSTGGCNNFMIGLSRMISLSARGGISLNDIVDQLMSTGSCPSYAARSAVKRDTSIGSCCPVAIAHALKDMYEEFQGLFSSSEKVQKSEKELNNNKNNKCPVCGSELTFEGGCNICKNCGWSKCD